MEEKYYKRIKERNEWIFDKNLEANLIVTDDLDSLFSALLLLHYRPNYNIGYYVDYVEGLYVKDGIDKCLPMIGVDLSHPTERCISNHVTKINCDDWENPLEINLNYIFNNVCVQNYHDKYNLSTLILLYSLFNLHPDNDVTKALLLLPDSAYLGAYAPDHFKDKYVLEDYLCNILQLPELWDFLRSRDLKFFKNLQEISNIKSKLWITAKGIETVKDVNLELICKYLGINYNPSVLEGFFYLRNKSKNIVTSVKNKLNKKDYFSFAVTSKNTVKCNKLEVVAMANVLDGTKSIDEFIVSMEDATGTVATASDAFDNNLNVQIELAKKMFLGLTQELGEKFMPIVNEILQWVVKNIPIIVEYIEDAINFIGYIINPFIDLIKFVIGNFENLSDSTDSNFSSIREIIDSVISAITSFIKAFVDFLKSIWDLLGKDLINFTKQVWDNLLKIIEGVLKILEGIFKAFSSLLKGDWQGLWEAIKMIVSGATSVIKSLIEITLNTIRTIWNAGWTLVKSFFKGIWNGIISFITGIVDSIKNTVQDAIDSVTSAIKKVLEWNALKPITHVITTINRTVNEVVDKVAGGSKSKVRVMMWAHLLCLMTN